MGHMDCLINARRCVPVLPVENLLKRGGGGVTLWEHRDADVSSEILSSGNFVSDFEGDFGRDGVVGLGNGVTKKTR